MSSAVLPVIAAPARSAPAVRRHLASWLAGAASAAVLLLAVVLLRYWRAQFKFDDAFMYCRYAMNLRHGGGIAWNPGGPHTFGVTSLPWFFLILAGSFVSSDPGTLLPEASGLTGLLAIAALTHVCNRSARSPLFRRFLATFPLIALPLLLNAHFAYSWTNGMETMLGVLSVTLFVLAHHAFCLRPSASRSTFLALAGALCALVRPELLLLVLALPLTHRLLLPRQRMPGLVGRGSLHSLPAPVDGRGRALVFAFAMLGILLGASLLANRLYFGSAVPLAFYIKAVHGYDGYRLFNNPLAATGTFLSMAAVPLLAMALTAQRQHLRFLLAYLVPVALVVAYLATVVQIMGTEARYYVPLLPLLLVPAVLLVDDAIVARRTLGLSPVRGLALLCVCLLAKDATSQFTTRLGRLVAVRRTYCAAPIFHTATPVPPLPEIDAWKVPAQFAHALPDGSTMVATEVGYLGAFAPGTRIIDAAGLNDAHMAHHPSDIDYLLAQHAELLWLPHHDYTALYGALASDPRLLEQYDLYAGALNFGLAIRKDLERQPAAMASLQATWQRIYPGYRMEDYRVRSVSWTPQTRIHGTYSDLAE